MKPSHYYEKASHNEMNYYYEIQSHYYEKLSLRETHFYKKPQYNEKISLSDVKSLLLEYFSLLRGFKRY